MQSTHGGVTVITPKVIIFQQHPILKSSLLRIPQQFANDSNIYLLKMVIYVFCFYSHVNC